MNREASKSEHSSLFWSLPPQLMNVSPTMVHAFMHRLIVWSPPKVHVIFEISKIQMSPATTLESGSPPNITTFEPSSAVGQCWKDE